MSRYNAADYLSHQERGSKEPRPRPPLPISYERSIARLRTRDRLNENRFYSEPKGEVGKEENNAD